MYGRFDPRSAYPVVDAAAAMYGLSRDELLERGRAGWHSGRRAAAIVASRELTSVPLTEIARLFNCRPDAVHYAGHRAKRDPRVRADADRIKRAVRQRTDLSGGLTDEARGLLRELVRTVRAGLEAPPDSVSHPPVIINAHEASVDPGRVRVPA